MRDVGLRAAKATLREWFAGQSREYLIRVVDECRAGIFSFSNECHCLIGCLFENPTASLYLQWKAVNGVKSEFAGMRMVPAEMALAHLQWHGPKGLNAETLRRARTLPLVLAEIRRRHRVPTAPPVEVACE